MAYFHFTVPEGEAPTRLDKFITKEIPQYSRSFLAKCELLINSKPAKASAKIQEGDLVEVKVPPLKEIKILAEKIPLSILHEDSEILVIEKPTGMVSHPTDHGGNVSGTLVNALLHHCKDLPGEPNRVGLVHRLDKETSGVMVIAKTEEARTLISKQFADRKVDKTYFALVVGKLKNKKGRIEAPIGRHTRDHTRRKISTAENAREAITEFEVREDFQNASLLEVKLLTGRTHQIRVHFNSIQHPVAGDSVYGFRGMNEKLKAPRLFLHSWKLGFTHPKTKKKVEFESKLPEDLETVLEGLRKI